MFIYGFLAVLPKIIVSYVVGLGIEFVVAQWKKEEIQEGFLVSGILIPMIVPVDCPLWILAVATAFSVIFAKKFGGTHERVQRCFDYPCIPVLRIRRRCRCCLGIGRQYLPVWDKA